MSASEIQILIGSIVGLIATLAGGCRWLLTHIEANQVKSNLVEEKARTELSNRLYEEIRVLRAELSTSIRENRVYLRRIYQLEAVIHRQPNLELPVMEGWPPV